MKSTKQLRSTYIDEIKRTSFEIEYILELIRDVMEQDDRVPILNLEWAGGKLKTARKRINEIFQVITSED